MRQRVKRSVTMRCGAKLKLFTWAHVSDAKLQNLVCMEADGTTRWHAALPLSVSYDDCFVALRCENDDVFATTFSGYEMRLNTATGEALDMHRVA